MKNWILTIIGSIIIFTACLESIDNTIQTNLKPFFDLKGFLNGEIEQLKGQQVSKSVTLNGKKETKTLKEFDFQAGLKMFVESDINKPAWFDAYQIDTTHIDSSTTQIKYTTTKEKLKIKSLQVNFDNDLETIQSIIIDRLVETDIYDAQQQLTYIPNQGFSINNQQEVALQDKNEYRIEVVFSR